MGIFLWAKKWKCQYAYSSSNSCLHSVDHPVYCIYCISSIWQYPRTNINAGFAFIVIKPPAHNTLSYIFTRKTNKQKQSDSNHKHKTCRNTMKKQQNGQNMHRNEACSQQTHDTMSVVSWQCPAAFHQRNNSPARCWLICLSVDYSLFQSWCKCPWCPVKNVCHVNRNTWNHYHEEEAKRAMSYKLWCVYWSALGFNQHRLFYGIYC